MKGKTETRSRGVTTTKKADIKVEEAEETSKFDLGGTSKISSNVVSNHLAAVGNVNVVCRFRPLNEKEKNISTEQCCDFLDEQRVAIRSTGENHLYKFSFDRIFDTQSNQNEVYEFSAKSIVESVLEGFNGTILAYGQTSSGKTHTMQGVIDNLDLEGIIPRMIRHIFRHILDASADLEFTVKVSMIEIYQEKIKDLIDVSRTNLNVREEKTKGLYIEDLSEHYVGSEEEVLEIMKIGSDNRSIGATNMNEHSSRSHSIFIMTIHQNNVKDLSAKIGKLYLVDLAGSEKISKTGATGLTLEEAKTINKSLTTLGMVINSLTDGKSTHVPYRESKLTRVLQESLGGNSKTCLIITCSPSVYNDSETISTLRFGLRAKKIKNKPKINKETTVAELKIEIDKLEGLLAKSNKRVIQLENYIINNGLTLPKEEDVVETKKKQNENLENDDEMDHHDYKKHIYVVNRNDKEETRTTMGFGLLTEQLKHERDFNKYQGNKMNQIENEKKSIKDKLEEMMKSLDYYSIQDDEKQELINNLINVKEKYETKEQELMNKISKLEENLSEEKAAKEIILKMSNMNDEENNKLDLSSNEDKQINKSNLENSGNESRQTIDQNEADDNILQKITDEAIPLGEIDTRVSLMPTTPNKADYPPINIINEFFSRLQKLTNDQDFSSIYNLIEEYKDKLDSLNNLCANNLNSYRMTTKQYPCDLVLSDEEEKFKLENEKKVIMKVLEEKTERLFQFELENRDLIEKLNNLESKFSSDDKPNLKKILVLEKNLEQLNKMFQHAMAQKSILTLDKESLASKLKKKHDKIVSQEKELNEMKEQIKIREEKLNIMQNTRVTLGRTGGNNLVRILKGGLAKQSVQLYGDFPIEIRESLMSRNNI